MRSHKLIKLVKNITKEALYSLILFWPLTIASISANYFYGFLYLKGKYTFKTIPMWIKIYVLYCFISFCIGVPLYASSALVGTPYFVLRAFISMIIFLLPLCLVFVKLNFDLKSLKDMCILITTIYTLFAFYNIFIHNFSLTDGYNIKNNLTRYVDGWPQGFSIFMIFSMFIILERIASRKINIISFFYVALFYLIFFCLYLTYLRSAYIAFTMGLLITFFRLKAKSIFLILYLIAVGFSIIYFSKPFNQDVFSDVLTRIQEPATQIMMSNHITDNSSNQRLQYWSEQITLLLNKNVLTGTGFAGISLFSKITGSSHSQYFDVLFRTGVIGLFFHIYMLIYLLVFYRKKEWFIFCGLCSIMVFGLFNETTKLSYLGLLVGLLLNYSTRQSSPTFKP